MLTSALEYLRSVLPPPLYSLLLTFLAHILAVLTAFRDLVLPLISTQPWDWDAQTVLPPLISLLAAYLALVSLYRTTTWAIRTSVWFLKWGLILAVVLGGTGRLLNLTKDLVTPGTQGGIMSGINDFVQDIINGQGKSPKARAGRKGSQKSRPKPWDSFERHREWRDRRPGTAQSADQQGDAQKYIGDLVGRMVTGWEMAKNMVSSPGKPEAEPSGKRGKTTSARGKSSRPR